MADTDFTLILHFCNEVAIEGSEMYINPFLTPDLAPFEQLKALH